jgi:hypothetical protein
MPEPNLIPWRTSSTRPPLDRYHALMPAQGWVIASYGVDEQAGTTPELYWDPVVCFAIQRGSDPSDIGEGDDDQVVALIASDGFALARVGDPLYEPYNGKTFGLYPAAAQENPEIIAGLLKEAESDWARKRADHERERAQRSAVEAFVRAQPDPASFASRMRASGCRSLPHAWLAMDLAQGDPAAAIRYAAESLWQLQKRHQAARAKTGAPIAREARS